MTQSTWAGHTPLPPDEPPSVGDIVAAVLVAPTLEALNPLAETVITHNLNAPTAEALLKTLKPGPAVLGFAGLFGERFSPEQRARVLHMLRLLEVEAEVPQVVRQLGSRDATVRAEAVRLLGGMGLWLPWDDPQIKAVISALRMALNHREDAEVRRLAAYSLGKMSAWEAADALMARLDEETEDAVREEVALALGRLQNADAVSVLLASYEAGEIEREVCLSALLRMEANATEALISIASRWNVALSSRVLATEALAQLRPPEAVEPLGIILERPHEPTDLRVAVAQALAALADPEAIPALESALTDPDAEPRLIEAAQQALNQLRGGGQQRLF